jgi:hypothetical protein
MKSTTIFGAVAVCFAGLLLYSYKPVWQFDHLEQNAKKAITGAELQAWATNLLAQYPSNTTLRASGLGTNFPQRLRSLAPEIGPDVRVNFPDDTNYPGWVMIGWGSGFLGHRCLEVGPTNFVDTSSKAHAWRPGVYFYSR